MSDFEHEWEGEYWYLRLQGAAAWVRNQRMPDGATDYLACDLGAESGRVMLGRLDGGRVEMRELHRFGSAAVRVGGGLYWDVLRIFGELQAGMKAAARCGAAVASVSTDSWGVDYVWVRDGEPMVAVPFHYRDARNEAACGRVCGRLGREAIFDRTGNQFMDFNTLFQIEADVRGRGWVLEAAEGFLNIADYFNWLMSGVARAEETLASTTQMVDPRTREWALDLCEGVGLPARLLPGMVAPGTVLGPLCPVLASEVGLEGVQVVATCSHDTAAAVAAVPAEGGEWAYLSSGTWSLLGIESPRPIITAESRRLNFTNEAGLAGTTRFLKNIVGLWVVQECRRAWADAGETFDYAALTGLAGAAEPLRSLIWPGDARFSRPGSMPEKIAAFCRETGQPEPVTPGQFVRCALESLALDYRRTLSEVESAAGCTIKRLHIVGGGSRNALLNQFAASATGRTVLAGPDEATALGNILVQALALGHLDSPAALRNVVRRSVEPAVFEPRDAAAWDAAAARFDALVRP